MKSFLQIKRKIKTIEGIKRVVRATSLIANTKLQNLSKKLLPLSSYYLSLYSLCGDIVTHFDRFKLEENFALFSKRKPKKLLIIVFTSDKGFCGSYNNKVLSIAYEESRQLIRSGKKLEFVTFGKYAYELLIKNNRNPLKNYPAVSTENLDSLYNELNIFVCNSFISKAIDECYVYYNSYINHQVKKEKILPMEFVTPKEKESQAKFLKADFDVENNDISILENIFEHYQNIKMKTIMLDTLTQENFDRMFSMQQAEKNAEELINNLTVEFNKARKNKITRELLEVVSSAEALK